MQMLLIRFMRKNTRSYLTLDIPIPDGLTSHEYTDMVVKQYPEWEVLRARVYTPR